MVYNLFDIIHTKLFDGKNQVAAGAAMLYGWLLSIYTLLPSPTVRLMVTWDFILKAGFGIVISIVTTVAVLLTTDIYKAMKPKVLVRAKKYYAIFKTKNSKNGNSKKSESEGRAA